MKEKVMLFRSLFLLLFVSSLAACGGKFPYSYVEGTPSTEAAADLVITSSTIPVDIDPDNGPAVSYASVNAANTALNGAGGDLIATTDTGARAAWQQGWTGKDVKVGLPDNFNANGRLDDHGDHVAIVAAAVAPEANYYTMDMLDVLGDGAAFTADEALAYFEDNGYHIINASWGIEKYNPSTGALLATFDTIVADAVAGFDGVAEDAKLALIVYAAGNSGNFCPGKRIEDCSTKGAEIDKLKDAGRDAGEKIIFVGSLADGVNTMAGYSLIAGDLMNDFIVAHDDILSTGDQSGTSFAAPRVTGAAALVRHKFPNLASEQLKQVLLQTATDLGDPGVDATFGHGQLNIAGALSPQGTVVPK
jgi:subtilisin family serine protease